MYWFNIAPFPQKMHDQRRWNIITGFLSTGKWSVGHKLNAGKCCGRRKGALAFPPAIIGLNVTRSDLWINDWGPDRDAGGLNGSRSRRLDGAAVLVEDDDEVDDALLCGWTIIGRSPDAPITKESLRRGFRGPLSCCTAIIATNRSICNYYSI